MKIAVFDHVGNQGGGSRFSRALLINLKYKFPSIEIVYFGNSKNILREKIKDEFDECGITIRSLHSDNKLKLYFYRFIKYLSKNFPSLKSIFPNSNIHKRIEKLSEGFDIAFFPWPYLLEYPKIDCPIVAVFHDFNYRYFWGTHIFNDEQLNLLEQQMPIWLKNSTPVVSSRFTDSQLKYFFPEYGDKSKIIPLAPFAISSLTQQEAMKILERFGIDTPYLIYPANQCAHKNIGNLLSAIYYLQQKGIELNLVLTGPGTHNITGTATEYGVEKKTCRSNVVGLGYVTNDQIDALIQCAKAVITPSFYEAGNGPGLDAWSKGVPVIMSNIPSFVEHMDTLGVKATLFDPKNPHDIAQKIQYVLYNYDLICESALESQSNISKHSWDYVANNYYLVFEELHKNNIKKKN